MWLFKHLADKPIVDVAPMLLGQILRREIGESTLTARIVEVEAYHQDDPASHTFRGSTRRNQTMFGPAGRAYVYLTYGIHHCFNVTAGADGEGAAILIRAAEPIAGIDIMAKNRQLPVSELWSLCSGPGKLTQAFGIDLKLNGHDLSLPPLQLIPGETIGAEDTVTTTRVGISKATDAPLRFYIKDNAFVSKL